ncbi:MAG: TRAP transporter substrate-binding protein DctP [Alphaproteobacteria bacterium]|nr:TRAP transporter substrate-binding protein DctP [Alphaproteobacteria bacterium]
MKSGNLLISAAAIAATTFLVLPAATAAEVELTAVTGVSGRSVVSQVFLRWVKEVNQRGKGIVRIKYLGGPEITPPFQQAQALKRGLFHMLYAPGAFYAGQVKEVDALIASNKSIQDMRKNGSIAYLDKLWRAQIGSHILGWFDTHVRFHMYFSAKTRPKMPTNEAEMRVMLRGIKLFSTPTFRGFQKALGATPVALKVPEILPSMDKGVIQGYGWPEYGMTGLGMQRVTKYRLDPTYYRGNILTLINARKWDSLPANVKAFLNKEVIAYEAVSAKWVRAQVNREQGILKKAGMQVLTLNAALSSKYRAIAHEIAWKRLARRSPKHAAKLRALMYDPALD